MSVNRLFASVFVLGLLGSGLGACDSGTSTEDFCNEKCICESCTIAQQSQCTITVEAERTTFEDGGCDYDAYLDCAGESFTCADTGLSFSTVCRADLDNSCDTIPAGS